MFSAVFYTKVNKHPTILDLNISLRMCESIPTLPRTHPLCQQTKIAQCFRRFPFLFILTDFISYTQLKNDEKSSDTEMMTDF